MGDSVKISCVVAVDAGGGCPRSLRDKRTGYLPDGTARVRRRPRGAAADRSWAATGAFRQLVGHLAVAQMLLGAALGPVSAQRYAVARAVFPNPKQPGHHKRLKNARELLCR